jgi:hypothetical protein
MSALKGTKLRVLSVGIDRRGKGLERDQNAFIIISRAGSDAVAAVDYFV